MIISEAAKLLKVLISLESDEIPIIIPTFNLPSYLKIMINQLEERGVNNYIVCDNNSTYPEMIEYLDLLSDNNKNVVRFSNNLGPRIFCETKEFLSILPEYFIITDPDILFNKSLPNNFIKKIKRVIDTYEVSKCGFAIDIFDTRNKFFKGHDVDSWEGIYWKYKVDKYQEKDDLYYAPIDTTFSMYKKSKLIDELISTGAGVTSTSSIRIAGRFTCEHMGWWENQPLTQDEINFYKKTQIWSATDNYKKGI